jgi:hypothetical protein
MSLSMTPRMSIGSVVKALKSSTIATALTAGREPGTTLLLLL